MEGVNHQHHVITDDLSYGGTGGGIAYNREEFTNLIHTGLRASPVGTILVEESVLGWKEYELEVMRDKADNVVIVCSIENIDAMGVHTGDSITVAPAMTLTDREYQRMRDVAIGIIREVGVDTGGCNIQFAVNPADGRMIVIEMNPRVSRSSALASKATGFPIAKIAARFALRHGHRSVALVSTDGDSDRPLIVDEIGRFHRGDVVGLVAAEYLQAESGFLAVTIMGIWLANMKNVEIGDILLRSSDQKV